MLSRPRIPVNSDKFDVIELRGGLDLLTPSLKLRNGYLRDALNWEQSITGGYSRIAGYERHDGRPSPSAATYNVLTLAITVPILAGNVITGVTSGATCVVISVTESLVAYTKATGSFVVAETITVGGSPCATVTELGGVDSAPNWSAVQRALAANVYRADIAAVPGSGLVLGVASLAGVRYAWRNNAPGTACAIYKTTSGGWTLVPLGFEMAFNTGTAEYAEGATISKGGTSAIVRRITVESGTWGAGTAVGRIIMSSITGGPFTAGAAAGGGAVNIVTPESAIVLAPSGRVETDIGNFGGGPRLYGCDGQNRGFEFDGTHYVPIRTPMTVDKPTRVLCHKGHLWFAFGNDLLNSSIASNINLYPQYNWEVVNGAVQYAFEGAITCLLRQGGSQETGVMSIGLENCTKMMYGSSAADFKPIDFEDSAGARPYGAQRLGNQSLSFGSIGVYSVSATQAYGNFTPASMTMNIRPWTQTRRNLASASLINREKSQYRVFFSDGYGLYMTVANGKLIGALPVHFPNRVTCACQGDTPDGAETSFFGSDNGFVYQLDSGTSHDGAAIESHFTLAFANQGNSQVEKNYRSASFEVQGAGYSEFRMTYEIGYGAQELVQGSASQTVALNLSPVYWDSFTWDAFIWDGRTLAPSQVPMEGTAENVAIRVDSNSDLYEQFTINTLVLRYKARRGLRGGIA